MHIATSSTAPFEPTNSWCYHFARYTAIPEIVSMPEVASGQTVRLLELTKKVLNKYLTPDQQSTSFLRAESQRPMTIYAAVRWYVPFIAKNTGQLVAEGGGMYRLPRPSDVDEDQLASEALDEAVEAAADAGTDLGGWLYAFTFPMIKAATGPYPIKIGMTAVDVERRVATQCRQSATFEQPEILARWSVTNVVAAEQAVHNVLKYRGRWRQDAPGTEWFNTTVSEIAGVVRFLDAQ